MKKRRRKSINCSWSGYCFDQKAFEKWRRDGLKKRKKFTATDLLKHLSIGQSVKTDQIKIGKKS